MDFNNNYVLGNLDVIRNGVDYLGINSTKYINAGAILINLVKIRNDNKVIDLFNFINKDIKLTHLDQTIINYVFYPNIGILPSEFVIWNFYDELDIRKYASLLRMKVNISEIMESLKSPTIIHAVLCLPKMWEFHSRYISENCACKQRGSCSCDKYHNLWHFYANKTDYYEEIKRYTKCK